MYFPVCTESDAAPYRTVGSSGSAARSSRLASCTLANFDDPALHDSHVASTPRNLFFPDDLAQLTAAERDGLWSEMNNVAACLADLLRTHTRGFEESEYAFEVLGLDFLVDRDDLHPPSSWRLTRGLCDHRDRSQPGALRAVQRRLL
eukprot:TRINITY_DN403_c0_g1_i3.p3 TRINITY_DN403_c0_g1~~TRINITY_DN403_c0_g1_i3.p3  ORF type:complete len:147 (-),score=16.34 TRINITY_DN403_c0_g1_i3:131-571(-)